MAGVERSNEGTGVRVFRVGTVTVGAGIELVDVALRAFADFGFDVDGRERKAGRKSARALGNVIAARGLSLTVNIPVNGFKPGTIGSVIAVPTGNLARLGGNAVVDFLFEVVLGCCCEGALVFEADFFDNDDGDGVVEDAALDGASDFFDRDLEDVGVVDRRRTVEESSWVLAGWIVVVERV